MSKLPGPPYPGIYLHYKGNYYVVHKIIRDSTNNKTNRVRGGKVFVLYESPEFKKLNIREIREFMEHVHPDGTAYWKHHTTKKISSCKKCTPRFKMIYLK